MNIIIRNRFNTWQKLFFILVVILIHSSVWTLVNNYNSQYPADQLNDLSILIDQYIPYIGWSWFIYYTDHIYIVTGTTFAIWNFNNSDFLRITILFCLMIIVGGIIQLIIPAKSPLPRQMDFVHAWMHQNISHDPFVCFPSMHVSLATLPTFLLLEKLKTTYYKILLILVFILICISTVTLKEHYFIDIPGGLIMGYFFYKLFHLRKLITNRRLI